MTPRAPPTHGPAEQGVRAQLETPLGPTAYRTVAYGEPPACQGGFDGPHEAEAAERPAAPWFPPLAPLHTRSTSR